MHELRLGFNGSRSVLFYELARILEQSQADFGFFENVGALKRRAMRPTMRAILLHLDKLGYDTRWQVLNCRVARPSPYFLHRHMSHSSGAH